MAKFGTTRTVEVAERRIEISNPDKPLYPDARITKTDVVDYYRSVADVMLTHLRGRPLTLRRFPDGIDEDGFFQKEASDHFPDWVRTVEVPQRTQSGVVRHVVCEDAATLVFLANQACLELHGWLSLAESLDHPDRMVVDLDPAGGIGAVVPYSLRALPGAPVATPIDWSELGRVEPSSHTLTTIGRRLAQKSDPWARLPEHGHA